MLGSHRMNFHRIRYHGVDGALIEADMTDVKSNTRQVTKQLPVVNDTWRNPGRTNLKPLCLMRNVRLIAGIKAGGYVLLQGTAASVLCPFTQCKSESRHSSAVLWQHTRVIWSYEHDVDTKGYPHYHTRHVLPIFKLWATWFSRGTHLMNCTSCPWDPDTGSLFGP